MVSMGSVEGLYRVCIGSSATLFVFFVFVYRMCSRNMTISRPFRGFLSGHYEKQDTKKVPQIVDFTALS